MKAIARLVLLAAMCAVMLALPAGNNYPPAGAGPVSPSATTSHNEVYASFDFEQQLGPWQAMTDNPYHLFSVMQQSGSNGCADMRGNHFARLVTASRVRVADLTSLASFGPSGFGSWIFAGFEVGGQGTRQATVQWSARWSPELPYAPPAPNEETDHAAVYVGLNPPGSNSDFALPARNYMTHQWQTYKYRTYVTLAPASASSTTPVYVGVGWDDTGDSMDLDCLSVEITYQPVSVPVAGPYMD